MVTFMLSEIEWRQMHSSTAFHRRNSHNKEMGEETQITLLET